MSQDERCERSEAEIRVMEEIAASPAMRRELLWLRAREREDWGSMKSLARADPLLAERMCVRALDFPRDRRQRAAAFGRLHDLRRAAARLEAERGRTDTVGALSLLLTVRYH